MIRHNIEQLADALSVKRARHALVARIATEVTTEPAGVDDVVAVRAARRRLDYGWTPSCARYAAMLAASSKLKSELS
jgi:hypothetical protein